MDPLLKTALFRCLVLFLWASLSAWLFVIVEDTGKNESDEKFKLLRSLYESLASKYNMTVEEFNNFSNVAHEALSEPKPKWTYPASVDFVFQAITTVGMSTKTRNITNLNVRTTLKYVGPMELIGMN